MAVAIHGETTDFRNAHRKITDADLAELTELWDIVDLR
jgi:hypothetical protein